MGNISDRPVPLLYYYVGKKPLFEVLPASQHLGGVRLLGRDCDAFLFPEVQGLSKPQHWVYILDRDTAVPLKAMSFKNRQDIDDNVPMKVWETTKFANEDGHLFSRQSNVVILGDRDYNKSNSPMMITNYDVTAIKLNGRYEDEMFWPKMQKQSAMIVDRTTNKITIPKNTPRTRFDSETSVGTSEPIRVEESDGWLTLTACSLFGLGVCMTVIAGSLMWRRK